MPLLTAVLTSWAFIIVFALLPKRLNLVELIFVFFVTIIIMTSTFTLMDINLHIVVIDKRPEYAFAIIIVRTILFPTVFMVSASGVSTQSRWTFKLGAFIFPFFVLLGIHWAFEQMRVITLQGWNLWSSCIMFLLLTGVIHLFSWGFTKLRLAG